MPLLSSCDCFGLLARPCTTCLTPHHRLLPLSSNITRQTPAAAACCRHSLSFSCAVCNILPSLETISCAWGDTSGANAFREVQLTVLPTKSGICTFSLVTLAAGKSATANSSITFFTPTCDSFTADGTAWSKAPGNTCPTGTFSIPPAATGVVNPGPTTCCTSSQETAGLQVSVTLPAPGHRLENRQFLFILNVSYPVGLGPAAAKEVTLQSKLPHLLTPADMLVLNSATSSEWAVCCGSAVCLSICSVVISERGSVGLRYGTALVLCVSCWLTAVMLGVPAAAAALLTAHGGHYFAKRTSVPGHQPLINWPINYPYNLSCVLGC